MPKVEITRQGTRSVDINELMQNEVVKQTLRFAAREFEGLPGPREAREGAAVVAGSDDPGRVDPAPAAHREQER